MDYKKLEDCEFVVEANFAGELFFKCLSCEQLISGSDADVHASDLHHADYMSIKRVPINPQETKEKSSNAV